MKKILLLCVMVLSSAISTWAAYDYLTFATGSSTTTLSVEGLTMSVSSSTLSVTNTAGANHNFTLTELSSIYFSDSEGEPTGTGLDQVLNETYVTKFIQNNHVLINTEQGVYDMLGHQMAAKASGFSPVQRTRQAVNTSSVPVLNIVTGEVTWAFPANIVGTMNVTSGTSITVVNKGFAFSDIDGGLAIDYNDVTDNTVTTTYASSTAAVVVAGNVAQYIDVEANGATISITQSTDVSASTCGEITYSLTGSSSAGSYYMSGSYKATVELTDLTLTSTTGAAVQIADGKRIDLVINGTNTLVDCASGSQKACLIIKGHPEVKGSGTLTVTGNTKHGIKTGEYLQLKKTFTGSIIVRNAVGDGLHIGQYLDMKNGDVTVTACGDDGIQVEANLEEEEYDGQMFISGGTITATISAAGSKGLKADSMITISDTLGYNTTINITTTGGGVWDADDLSVSACAAIKASSILDIRSGTFTLKSTGGGGKGIKCDSTLYIRGGTINVTTSGNAAYCSNTSSGTMNNNYTSSLERISSARRSSPKGIKCDYEVYISGGAITVNVTGNGGEGLESKAPMYISGGTHVINAYDDAINASTHSDYTNRIGHLYISGSTITAVSSGNDGIDSNGNMYISGGIVMGFGTSLPECGIDVNEEDHYQLYITGGTILGVGGSNSVPSSSASTQCYVSYSASVSANSTLTLKSGSTILATFTVPSNYSSSSQGGFNFVPRREPGGGSPGGGGSGGGGSGGGGSGGGGSSSSVLVSCSGLVTGTTYTLTYGSSQSTAKAQQYSSSFGR